MTPKNNFDRLLFTIDTIGGDAHSQLLPDVVGEVQPVFCSIIPGEAFDAGSCT